MFYLGLLIGLSLQIQQTPKQVSHSHPNLFGPLQSLFLTDLLDHPENPTLDILKSKPLSLTIGQGLIALISSFRHFLRKN